jgi:glutathione S-transferase
MTLKLYFAPGACSFVPHTLLEAAGEPFEPVMVKLHKQENYSPEYKAINPRSQVPVLVDGGETITQIVAIVGYLSDRFAQAGFLPREPLARARVLETLAWMNNTVHPTFTHIFMPHKFTDKPAGWRSPARWAGPGRSRRRRCPARGRRAGTPARARPRDARAGVLHLQHQHLAERVGQHARGDHAGLRVEGCS